jgi:hypothetical protein
MRPRPVRDYVDAASGGAFRKAVAESRKPGQVVVTWVFRAGRGRGEHVPITIPDDVALFLDHIGLQYPYINEDQVRALATHVRNFADGVRNTHDTAARTIKEMGTVYSGYSYRQLVAAWARNSSANIYELDAACRRAADALDAAAEFIRKAKVATLAELAGLAVSYAAAMDLAIAIGGVLEQAVAAAAANICEVLEQSLIGDLLGEVIGKAIEPLGHIMVHGQTDGAAKQPLLPEGSPTETLYIEPDEVTRYIGILDQHTNDILQLAANFANTVAGLDFTSPFSGSPGTTPATDRPIGSSPSYVPVAATASNGYGRVPNRQASASNGQPEPARSVVADPVRYSSGPANSSIVNSMTPAMTTGSPWVAASSEAPAARAIPPEADGSAPASPWARSARVFGQRATPWRTRRRKTRRRIAWITSAAERIQFATPWSALSRGSAAERGKLEPTVSASADSGPVPPERGSGSGRPATSLPWATTVPAPYVVRPSVIAPPMQQDGGPPAI